MNNTDKELRCYNIQTKSEGEEKKQIKCDEFTKYIYDRLTEDWRHYDNLLWQIPFGTATAVGIVLTLIYYYLRSSSLGTIMLKLGLLFILIIFVLTMMILSIKIRYFQIERAICIEEIEQTCAHIRVPYKTEDAHKIVEKEAPFESSVGKAIKAYHLQVILFISIIVALIFAIIATAQQLSPQYTYTTFNTSNNTTCIYYVYATIKPIPSYINCINITSLLPNWSQIAISWMAVILILLLLLLFIALVLFLLFTIGYMLYIGYLKNIIKQLLMKIK